MLVFKPLNEESADEIITKFETDIYNCDVEYLREIIDSLLSDGECEYALSQSLSCTALAFSLGTERAVIAATPTAECAAKANVSFTVYYPGRDETPWDIAKKYRVREEDLILHEPERFSESTRRTAVLITARRSALYRRVVEE
jgi:hypothetical protein